MKDCGTLRAELARNPRVARTRFAAHAAECPSCRAFGDRLLRAEALIGEALRFDVDALSLRAAAPAAARTTGSRWINLAAGAAAACLAVLTVWGWADRGVGIEPGALAAAVVAHWDHEPESLARTDVGVSDALLAEVLAGTAELDPTGLRTVSFAKICRIGGRLVPHLVVQGETGPYMIVLLPGQRLPGAVPLEAPARGLAGRILPAGSGSIAVLGAAPEELDAIQSEIGAAVSWSI